MPSDLRDITITMGADTDALEKELDQARKNLNAKVRAMNEELKKLGQQGMTEKQTKVFNSLKQALIAIQKESAVVHKQLVNTFADFSRGSKVNNETAIKSIEKLIKRLLDLNAEGRDVTATMDKLGHSIATLGAAPAQVKSRAKKGTGEVAAEEQVWKRPSETLSFITKGTQAGAVDVQSTITNYRMLTNHLNKVKLAYDDCKRGLGEFATLSKQERGGILPLLSADMEKTKATLAGVSKGFRGMASGISGVVTQMRQMVEWQAVWYGSRALLFALVGAPIAFEKTALEFGIAIDNWRAQLLRWEATTGKVSDSARKSIDAIILEARKAAIDVPLSFEKITEALEGFIGAGVPLDVTKSLVPQIAKLKAAFPDINFESFGVAITGAWNAFRESMKGAITDAGKFTTIMEQLLRAQARGIIRPEQFTVVIQHLGEMSRIVGLTTEEMFSMAVVITDMGSRSGNAARSLRGMMDQLAKPKTFRLLTEAGVELNTELTLADMLLRKFTTTAGKEVPSILDQLRKILGEGGGKSYKALSFLSQMFPVERAKSLTGMMDQVDKFNHIVEELKNAQNAMEKANEVMAQRFTGQVQILTNRWRELAAAVGLSSGVLKEAVVVLNDMLLAALLAVDSAAVSSGKSLNDLGAAGVVTYAAVKSLKDTIEGLLKPLTILGGLLTDVTKGLSASEEATKGFTTALRMLINVIIAGVATAAIGKILALAGSWMGLE